MRLFYREYGEGPPVLLLHGLLGSFENWHTIATMLEDSYRLIVPDLRNHGRSPHSDDFDYTVLSNDIRELIESLQLDNPVLAGHSMGGKTAMELALRFPEVVKAVVVEDMLPGETQAVTGEYIRMLLELDLESAEYRKELEEELLAKVGNRRVALFLLKNLARRGDNTFYWRSNLRALKANYDQLWKGLQPGRSWTGPALFLRGALSDVVPDESFEEILDFFPRAKIVTVENATHWVHFDAAPDFVSHLRGFLEDVEHL